MSSSNYKLYQKRREGVCLSPESWKLVPPKRILKAEGCMILNTLGTSNLGAKCSIGVIWYSEVLEIRWGLIIQGHFVMKGYEPDGKVRTAETTVRHANTTLTAVNSE